MYNNTLTSTKQYALTSSFEVHYAMPLVQKWNTGIVMEMSVSEAGYLFSIELNREKIKSELCDFFRFKSKNKEVDFLSLSNNQELRKLLPSMGSFFKKQFGDGSLLCLELMEEEENWQTLFINVSLEDRIDWACFNIIIDEFFDNMFNLFPQSAEKINIDLA